MAIDPRTRAASDSRPSKPRVGRDRRWTRRNTILTIVGIISGLLTVFPLVWMLTSSFKPAEEINTVSLFPASPTIENFVYVFAEVPFLRYMFNSFFVSATITVLALFFHSMAAYALARLKFRGTETVFLLIFSTLLVGLPVVMIPTFVVVLLFFFFFQKQIVESIKTSGFK